MGRFSSPGPNRLPGAGFSHQHLYYSKVHAKILEKRMKTFDFL
jgi:hypothetical protein